MVIVLVEFKSLTYLTKSSLKRVFGFTKFAWELDNIESVLLLLVLGAYDFVALY